MNVLKKVSVVIAVTSLLTFLVFPVQADENVAKGAQTEGIKGKMSLGINYPGVSFKYGLSNKIALEAKGQFGKDVLVTGGRCYYNFNSKGQIILFTGGEVDYIDFKGEYGEGSGWAIEGFVGGEYFVAPSLGFQLDFGPAWINLEDDEISTSVEGIEYIVNIGINYYFGGGK